MSKPIFEILDCVDTPLGPLWLRRRELLGQRGTIVTEVTLDHELLMSSLNTASEEALSTRSIAWHGRAGQEGQEALEVLVGGLGLGYTAQAALAEPRVAELCVIERLPEVIRWLSEDKFPTAAGLNADPRLKVEEADVYELLLGPATRTWDLILIDVDHTPSEPLGPTSAPFYTAEGLKRVAEHLAPGGVLCVWSAGDDEPFAETLAEVFPDSTREIVRWENLLIDDGQWAEDVLFLARKPAV